MNAQRFAKLHHKETRLLDLSPASLLEETRHGISAETPHTQVVEAPGHLAVMKSTMNSSTHQSILEAKLKLEETGSCNRTMTESSPALQLESSDLNLTGWLRWDLKMAMNTRMLKSLNSYNVEEKSGPESQRVSKSYRKWLVQVTAAKSQRYWVLPMWFLFYFPSGLIFFRIKNGTVKTVTLRYLSEDLFSVLRLTSIIWLFLCFNTH